MTRSFDVRTATRASGFGPTDSADTGLLRSRRVVATTGSGGAGASGLEAGAGTGSFLAQALSFVSGAAPSLGLAPGQAADFTGSPFPAQTNAGARGVYLIQTSQSIAIFEARQTVIFGPDGLAQMMVGAVAAVAPGIGSTRPPLAASEALGRALDWLQANSEEGVDGLGQPVTDPAFAPGPYDPVTIAQFADRPDLPTVLSYASGAPSALARLTWLATDETLVLCWLIILSTPDAAAQYLLLVDSATGVVDYCTPLVRGMGSAADVYLSDPSVARQRVDLPPPVSIYGAPGSALPSTFPYPWVDAATTAGTDVVAHQDDDGSPLAAAPDAGVFSPQDPLGLEQCVLNAFYFACYLHDYYYLLGFKESDGNFQLDDFGLGGAAGDRVDVRVYPTAIWATANMSTPVDGLAPTLKLGLVTSSNRHTALDASVVIHESTHGLTNRLVGGALDNQSLTQPQSAAMGEGWSDFFACQLLDAVVVGSWVVDDPKGIRGFAYDVGYPATFADVGHDRYTEMHAVGEIWCAMLMSVARGIGRPRALSLVVDSLKLMPANPSMVDGRDAMLTALDHDHQAGTVTDTQHDQELAAMWTAFAHGGLGQAAASSDAGLSGLLADFTVPASLSPTWSAWASTAPPGSIPSGSAIAVLGSTPAVREVLFVGGDGSLGTISRGAGAVWGPPTGAGISGVPVTAAIAALGQVGATSELFVVGGDGRLYHTIGSGNGWTPWGACGPAGAIPPNAGIAAVGTPGSTTDIYAVGGDGHLYTTSRTGSAWSTWTETGPAGAIPPNAGIAAVGTPGSTIDIYAVGGDGGVYLASR